MRSLKKILKKILGYHALENKLHRPQHSPTQDRRVEQHMQNNPHTGPKASKQAGASRSCSMVANALVAVCARLSCPSPSVCDRCSAFYLSQSYAVLVLVQVYGYAPKDSQRFKVCLALSI